MIEPPPPAAEPPPPAAPSLPADPAAGSAEGARRHSFAAPPWDLPIPPWGLAILFVLLSVALYANTLGAGFVFDDRELLFRSDAHRSIEGFQHAMGSGALRYRPVRLITYAIDHAIGGDAPWIYHISSAVYHGIVAFVALLVMRRLSGSSRAAVVGALLFLVHPLQTESVAYVSGRRDILTCLFYLLAFLSYLRWQSGGGLVHVALTLGSFALAIGAKEMAATLPLLVLLHLALFDRQRLRRALPMLALGCALMAALAYRAWSQLATFRPGWPGGSLWTAQLTEARLYCRWAKLFLWPSDLLADYSAEAFPLSSGLLAPGETLPAVLAILIALGLVGILLRWRPRLGFLAAWFFVTMLPVQQIVPFHELAAEHHLYLPLLGPCLLVATAATAAIERIGRRPVYATLAAIIAALSIRTHVRNEDWRNDVTLWIATVEDAPRCARARLNLGLARARYGDLQGAERDMAAAVEARPSYIEARWERSQILERLGRHGDAKAEATEGLRLTEDVRAQGRRPSIHQGWFLIRLGRFAEAQAAFAASTTASTRRGSPNHWAGLGVASAGLAKFAEGLAAFERSLDLQPRNPDVLRRAASCAAKLGQTARARELMEQAEALGARRANLEPPPMRDEAEE